MKILKFFVFCFVFNLTCAQKPICEKNQVLINDECKNLVNKDSKCLDTKMCKTIGAKCFDQSNKERTHAPHMLEIERIAFCRCPFGHYYSQEKDKCLDLQGKCINNQSCASNYYCNFGICSCIFENDKDKFKTHCLYEEGVRALPCFKNNVPVNCNYTGLDLADNYSLATINQTWSTMMWKMSFLTIVLLLLMLLIKGILRSRQNENYLMWARAVAMQQEALRNNLHRSTRDISINMQQDLPPSYDDAIKVIQNERQTQTSI